jgi:outer membrane autotransporter protein
VSGTSGGALTLTYGQTLSGAGSVNGDFTVGNGAILVPGNPVGTLTFSNSLTLTAGSTNIFAISKSPLTNDVVDVGGNLTTGGSLIVTNIGTNALVAGDSFKLLSAGSYAGSFSSLTLPALASSLYWDSSGLGTAGTIRVAGRNPPTIGNFGVSAGSLVLNGTSGMTNGTYYVLTSTNLATRLGNWTRLLTNQFDAVGGFYFTNAMNPNSPQCYYLLQVP